MEEVIISNAKTIGLWFIIFESIFISLAMEIKESNITINIKDMDRSISFYEAIGFKTVARWGNYYGQLTAPGIIIGLHPVSSEVLNDNSGNVSIGFTTGDIKGTKAELEKLGVQTSYREEEGGQFLHFKDPDGAALYFIQPKW